MTGEFPRARHLELTRATEVNAEEAEARARAEGSQALLIDAWILPAPVAPAGTPSNPPPPKNESAAQLLARAGEVEMWRARDGESACADEDGNRAGGDVPVLCPSAARGRLEIQRAVAEAVSRSDAVVLSGIDRWYSLGHSQSGFCMHCERAMVETLRANYGEQVEPFHVIESQRHAQLPERERPYAGMRQAQRLSEPLGALRSAVLSARDAARKNRGAEISVLGRAGPLSALTLLAARHLDGLIVALPGTDAHDALLTLLCARAAMGERAAIAELPATARPDEVRQLAALATACDADVLLAADASPEARAALATHRKFAALLRERYRPALPLSDIDVLISPLADHQSYGLHLRASRFAVAALARAQLQLAVRLDVPAPVREGAKLLVLAGAESLPQALAPALRRHVESGSDLLLIGRCDRVDDEGRSLGPLFPEAKPGIERVGEGRLYWIAPPAESTPATAGDPWAQLEGTVQKAVRELLARTPRALTISGRGQLWARAYLDPERKLDVHLVNLDLREAGFAPAQGVLLQVAGAAAGGGRTGYWFSPERGGKDGERIALNPSGFSVSTVLPAVGALALLSVPR